MSQIEYQTQIGKLWIEKGDSIVSMTTYKNYILVVTKLGNLYRVVIEDPI
jgi:hypothetical protein